MTTEQQQPENHTNAETPLEQDEPMDPTDALKQAGRIANSPSDVILKYVVIGVLTLFGFLFFFQWKQNQSSPDKVISILERTVDALTASQKIQEASLSEIQKFAIQVPMEHRDMAAKQSLANEKICQIETKQADLQDAIKANSDAVKENTAAVARLIGVIEQRLIQESSPNDRAPPKS